MRDASEYFAKTVLKVIAPDGSERVYQAGQVVRRLNPLRIEWVGWGNAVASVPQLSESALTGPGVSPHHARQARLELEARLAEHAVRAVIPPS